MVMKKRFLVLIDFSPGSADLLRYAYDWSRVVHAEILLVHHTTLLLPLFTEHDNKLALKKMAKDEALEKLKKFAKETLSDTTRIQYLVSEAPLLSVLSKALKEPFEHLVFLGLKGAGVLKKIFIGSTAIRVIENTPAIVAAIPLHVERFSAEKIYVAINDRNLLNIIGFNRFLQFIENKTGQLIFFSLTKPEDDITSVERYLQDLRDMYKNTRDTSYEIYSGANLFENIKSVINNKTAELLVLQKGSRLLSDHYFRKFVINELVYDGETPLIVLP